MEELFKSFEKMKGEMDTQQRKLAEERAQLDTERNQMEREFQIKKQQLEEEIQVKSKEMMSELKVQKEKLELVRKELEEREAKLTHVASAQTGKVKLNVGGKYFVTS